jgi:hypothetical protein
MNRSLRCFPLALLIVLLSAPTPLSAQEPPKPTKEHEELKSEVGGWDAEMLIWPAPGAEPMKSKGVETNEMFGPYWLMSKYEGEVVGQKFTGHMMLGYDPAKKKYIGTWIDTMSPFGMTMEGDYDESTHTSTMMGVGTSWETGKPEKTKMVTRYESDDEKTFEMYMEKPGEPAEWVKGMEIKYNRRK